jgi:Mlc titration factor MtfA (ptsG expression regulator)
MTGWGDWHRRRILKRVSFDADVWHAALAAPLYAGLNTAERARLYDLARLFIAEKIFSGAAGFAMDEITRLRIAAQAALLLMNLDLDSYAGWKEIIVYPNEFVPLLE